MQKIIENIFSISKDIRYVAIYNKGELTTLSKEGTEGASSSDSDRYEELIVNPTVLTLVKQRGDIDCGGANYVLIKYGNFYQFVAPTQNGHASVCIEPYANPLELAAPIQNIVQDI